MLAAMIATVVLVMACVLIHYEILRLTSDFMPRLSVPPRPRMLVVIGAAFLAHTIEVWVFAVAYYGLQDHLGFGSVEGASGIVDLVYFSAETYTSLGFGDVYPLGGLRLVAGVEALLGLLMIGWSGSFTYLEMQRYWKLHGEGSKGAGPDKKR
ncbi:MAG: ion channel [Gemmatimonas sp.]